MELSIVLDTNAYSDWRRSGRWHNNIARADKVILPAIVIGELLHGFRQGRMLEANLVKLHEFLTEPQVSVMPVTYRTAEIYSEFLVQLQSQGTPISTNDIWIAAMVHECLGELASRDDHFKNLPQIVRSRE